MALGSGTSFSVNFDEEKKKEKKVVTKVTPKVGTKPNRKNYPDGSRGQQKFNIALAKWQRNNKPKVTPKKGAERRIKGTGELQKWDGTKWLKYKEWKAAEKEAAKTSVKDATPGGDQQGADLDMPRIRQIAQEQANKDKETKNWTKAAGSGEVAQGTWVNGKFVRSDGKGDTRNNVKSKGDKQVITQEKKTTQKEVERKTQPTNEQKIAKLEKRIKRGGMMMKRGQMKRRLEQQIRDLKKKKDDDNKNNRTGSAFVGTVT